MKKTILLILFPLVFGCKSKTHFSTSSDISDQTVLICTGKASKSYHKGYCRGLDRCRGEIEEVSIEEAKSIGRADPCDFCYGH